MSHERTYRHLQLFCGLGGLAAGIGDSAESHAGLEGEWECIGAFDSDPGTIARFNRYTGWDCGRVVDFFNREQYVQFHGAQPPEGWREITPRDIREMTGGVSPNLVASSPPCKGFSGLLSKKASQQTKYQALNALVFRGIWLVLEAFQDDPPEFWLLENVPRISQRGAHYLEQLNALFNTYGYSVTGDAHCCGEVGGLAQRRKRYLMVARHRAKVPPLLFRPPVRPLRTVGDVLGSLPLPGDPRGGALHRPRRITFRTATRLALIPPGKDWRALQGLAVVDGILRDYAMVPQRYGNGGTLGVKGWGEVSATVTGAAHATTGPFSVADPRAVGAPHNGVMGVQPWDGQAPTVTGRSTPYTGGFAVSDPRRSSFGEYGQYGVVPWGETAGTVTTARSAGQGRFSVEDPRYDWSPNAHCSKLRVSEWNGRCNTVTGSLQVGSGAASIADPRPAGLRHNNVFRVVSTEEASPAVTAGGGPSSGGLAVADPVDRWMGQRGADFRSVEDACLPEPTERGDWIILSPHGGAWHRPFTTLELAALQGLISADHLPEEFPDLETNGPESLLDGSSSDTRMRQWIGNAVPRPTAKAIGGVILKCFLSAEAGETFALSSAKAWALPNLIAVQCAVDTPEEAL